MSRIAWLLAALGLGVAPHAAGRPAPDIILRGTNSAGDVLMLRVPVNLFAQLQQPGSGSNINLSQIGGTSVSASLYDGGNTALKVNCVVGCSATSGFSDNTAFTAGTTSVNNVSGVFNDAIAALTSGNAGAIRATSDRMLYVNVGKMGGTAVPSGLVDTGNNAFKVNCVTGCSASAGFTDNSAFTAGTTTETNIGGVFNDGLAAVTSGNAAAARLTPNRGLHVNLRNNSGTEIATASNPLRVDPTGTTTQPVSGTVTANAGTGTFTVGGSITANIGTTNGLALDASVNGILNAQGSTSSGQKGPLDQCAVTSSAPTYTTAQTDPLSCDTSGNLRTSVNNTVTVGGTVTANQGTANATPWNENVAQINGVTPLMGNGVTGTGSPRVTVASDNSNAPGIGGSATGSAVPSAARYVAGNASGNLTGAVFCDNFKAVSINTATTTIVIPLAASKTTYICGWHLFAAGADNVAFVYGTGTNCGTGTTAIAGGTTAATGYNFTAQTGIVVQLPMGSPVKETAAANDTCIITSAAVQLSGMISYTQF